MAVLVAGYVFFTVLIGLTWLARVIDRWLTRRNLRRTAIDRVVNFL